MKNTNSQIIALGVSILMAISFLAVISSAQKIGTSYSIDWQPVPKVDNDYIDTTGITSFRFGATWAWMDEVLDSNRNDYGKLADTLLSYVPSSEDVTKIIKIGFYHDSYMEEVHDYKTYKVDTAYVDTFKNFCFMLAESLEARGVDHFVLHNEPDLKWSNDSLADNWMATPEDFAEQCYWAAHEIKQANNDAYIFFGAFAGPDTGATNDTFVVRSVDSILNAGSFPPLVDCIDFHCYGESLTETEAAEIAHRLKTFCNTNRNVDWSIMETRGPRYNFPVDSLVYGTGDYTIKEQLIWGMQIDFPPWSEMQVLCSLYVWVRWEDPDHLFLSENWDDLEDEKIEEFLNRVPTFVDSGATFAHWFSAYKKNVVPLPTPPNGHKGYPTPMNKVDQIIKRAETFPANILDTDGKSTPLGDTIKAYIEGLERRYYPGAQQT
ncbi:MAG: hypothetical protein GF315_05980, partial [candidate division Zixibacteria bacterium]|nr:hypothetical protein [candidate division Zixibacteria bacterium]